MYVHVFTAVGIVARPLYLIKYNLRRKPGARTERQKQLAALWRPSVL